MSEYDPLNPFRTAEGFNLEFAIRALAELVPAGSYHKENHQNAVLGIIQRYKSLVAQVDDAIGKARSAGRLPDKGGKA